MQIIAELEGGEAKEKGVNEKGEKGGLECGEQEAALKLEDFAQ